MAPAVEEANQRQEVPADMEVDFANEGGYDASGQFFGALKSNATMTSSTFAMMAQHEEEEAPALKESLAPTLAMSLTLVPSLTGISAHPCFRTATPDCSRRRA